MPRSFSRARATSALVILIVVLGLAMAGAVAWGAAGWSVGNGGAAFDTIVWQIRMPRVVLGKSVV